MPLHLTDFPQDVLVKIFAFCDPDDVSSLAYTCKIIRDAALSRPVWLSQLANLDQSCAPNLLPHADVEALSSTELRRIVFAAIGTREFWTGGPPPRTQFKLQYTLPFTDRYACNTRISPGGRILTILTSRNELLAFDLAKGGKTHHLLDLSFVDVESQWVVEEPEYDIHETMDGSFILAFVLTYTYQRQKKNIFRVLRLTDVGTSGSEDFARCQPLISFPDTQCNPWITAVTVSPQYAVCDFNPELIIIQHSTPSGYSPLHIGIARINYPRALKDCCISGDHIFMVDMFGEIRVAFLPNLFNSEDKTAGSIAFDSLPKLSDPVPHNDDAWLSSRLCCYSSFDNGQNGHCRAIIAVIFQEVDHRGRHGPVKGKQIELNFSIPTHPQIVAEHVLTIAAHKSHPTNLRIREQWRLSRSCQMQIYSNLFGAGPYLTLLLSLDRHRRLVPSTIRQVEQQFPFAPVAVDEYSGTAVFVLEDRTVVYTPVQGHTQSLPEDMKLSLRF